MRIPIKSLEISYLSFLITYSVVTDITKINLKSNNGTILRILLYTQNIASHRVARNLLLQILSKLLDS